jgi:alpha,alpha-trehalose-phosphate synthase [UDP-forming]
VCFRTKTALHSVILAPIQGTVFFHTPIEIRKCCGWVLAPFVHPDLPMRLSVRLNFALVASVALVSLGLALYQTNAERRGLRRELDRRALVVAESLEKSAAPLIERRHAELQRLVETFAMHERLAGAAVYDSQGKPLAITPGMASVIAAQPGSGAPPQTSAGSGKFFTFDGRTMHGVTLPIFEDGNYAGSLQVFHDAGSIDAQAAAMWGHAFLGMVVQTVLIVCVTLLILHWSLRRPLAHLTKWLAELRGGSVSEGPDLPEEAAFKPLKQEAARLATTLTAARAAVVEEARLRQTAEALWTSERLRVFIQSRLKDSRIFVVSNREPYEHVHRGGEIECSVPASGLVTALEPVLRASGGTWIAQGTGDADRETVDENDRVPVPPDHPQYSLRRVFLNREEEEGFYFGFANEGLWPLCHIAHTRPTFRSEDFEHYRNVNQRFADALLEEIAGQPDPVVLVQDYHFALLPRLIKNARPDARVAIFWHIPWPNPEAFGICPWQNDLLDGLLGADLVGFHAQAHCNNFLDTVDRAMESRIDRERFAVDRHGRVTYVRPFPISVPFVGESPQPATAESRSTERTALLRANGVEASLMGIGVDRVDYTKGILERLRAVELFFDRYRAYRGRFTFVQIGAPSRTHIPRYQDLMREVTEEAERINRRFRSNGWRPIVFIPRHHSHEQILPYYRAADLCLVTSLHDGMNLVAKEFVAARSDEQAVLILSRFAGASHELTDALIINPYDTGGMADAIHAALEMSPEERQVRLSRMRAYVREHNIYRWAGSMIAELAAIRVEIPTAPSRRLRRVVAAL